MRHMMVDIAEGSMPGRAVIKLGGFDVSHAVSGYRIISSVTAGTRVVLELVLTEADYLGEAEVTVQPKVAAALVAMGWTPPDAGP